MCNAMSLLFGEPSVGPGTCNSRPSQEDPLSADLKPATQPTALLWTNSIGTIGEVAMILCRHASKSAKHPSILSLISLSSLALALA